MKHLLCVLGLLFGALLLLSACNFQTQEVTPAPDQEVIEEPINPLPDQPVASPSPSPSPSATQRRAVQIATALPTVGATDALGITTSPAATEGPWEYVVQAGDNLLAIVSQPPFNYRDLAVLDAVLVLNGLPSADSIVAGQTLLIPRPTPTPIPQGIELTLTLDAQLGLERFGDYALPANTVFDCHNVQENETIIGIVEQYGGATLEILAELNPDINFLGCNFELPGGGPGCGPQINVGQCVIVPQPTSTPTRSPTPSGLETPTPTPTYRAPSLVSPADGFSVTGGPLTLQWVTAGQLRPDEVYLIELRDLTASTEWREVTRNTSITLPAELIPTDGQTHQITWTVMVAVAQGDSYRPVSAVGRLNTFTWRGT